MDLLALKSFCKRDSDRIRLLIWAYHSKKEMDSIFSPFFYSNDNTFTFRNKEYVVSDLAKLCLFEYVDDLIDDDKQDCDMVEIKKFIDKLFKN